MNREKVSRGDGSTRKRILEAATRRFANASYDAIGLRDIATDVGVDVAHVHRSFGSKEALFLEVLRGIPPELDLPRIEPAALPVALAQKLFDRRQALPGDQVDPLVLFIRALSVPAAAPVIRDQLMKHVIDPMDSKSPGTSTFAAASVMSLLLGLSILRNILKLPEVTNIDRAEAEAFVAKAIAGLLTQNTAGG